MSWIRAITRKKSVFAKSSFSSIISKVAAAAVAISCLVMILSLSVLKGYKSLIKEKMAGFSGHIQVLSTSSAINYEYEPFIITKNDFELVKQVKHIKSIYPIAQKAGIAKSNNELEGIIIKGLFENYDSLFYTNILEKADYQNLTI